MKILLFLFSFSVSGAVLDEVEIFEIVTVKTESKIGMQSKNKNSKTKFFLVFDKKNPKENSKFEIFETAFKKKDFSKLKLKIPSFSFFPDGAKYKSNEVILLKEE